MSHGAPLSRYASKAEPISRSSPHICTHSRFFPLISASFVKAKQDVAKEIGLSTPLFGRVVPFPDKYPLTLTEMSQKFRVNDDRLGAAEMELDMGSMFTDPSLSLNGEVLNVRGGHCFVDAADGSQIPVEFKKQFMDRYPSVVLDEKVYTFGRPYKWFEKLALFLPFLLTVLFGVFGLAGGILLWLYNNRSFKTPQAQLANGSATA